MQFNQLLKVKTADWAIIILHRRRSFFRFDVTTSATLHNLSVVMGHR